MAQRSHCKGVPLSEHVIEVFRLTFGNASTMGLMSLDGTSMFSTLEPPFKSGMLMPPGKYHCKKTLSPHMGYVSAELQDVPGHVGERIHIGNTPADTHGCILIGETRGKDWIGSSKSAFDAFMQLTDQEFDISIFNQTNEAKEIIKT